MGLRFYGVVSVDFPRGYRWGEGVEGILIQKGRGCPSEISKRPLRGTKRYLRQAPLSKSTPVVFYIGIQRGLFLFTTEIRS